MKRFLLVLLPVFVVVGCKGPDTPYPEGPPPNAKITDEKSPEINNQTRMAAAQLAEAMGQPDKAIANYNEVLKTEPKQSDALYRLGVLYSQQKNLPAAIDAWQRYIVATNNAAAGWANLGFCYELTENNEAAEAAYKKGIERSSKDQLCRVNYGLMLARVGRINEALVNLQAVLTPAAAHYNLGSVYEQKGLKAQAKLEYTRSLELDPTFFDAQQRLATLE